MLRTAASKVMWVGRATVFLVGLAVILALLFGIVSVAFGANGDNFILGEINRASEITRLNGNVSGGAALRVNNPNTASGSRALHLNVADDRSPLTVNATAGKANNLNADKLDGLDSSEIGINGRQVVTAFTPSSSTSPKEVTARCPSDKLAVGSSFRLQGGKRGPTSDNLQTDVVVDSVEVFNRFVRVTAYEEESTDDNWQLFASAICIKGELPPGSD